MLQTHYRSPLDFSYERLDGTVGTLDRIKNTVRNLRWAAEAANGSEALGEAGETLSAAIDETRAEFTRSMDDDFNTAGALAAIFGLVTAANTYLDAAGTEVNGSLALRAADALVELLGVFGIESVRPQAESLPVELVELAEKYAAFEGHEPAEAAVALIEARAKARKERDWATADGIRDAIANLGLVVEDTPTGTRIIKG
jgi:cysteinyl-tRNA synthetase